jgi:hypothetical protein
MLLKDNLSSLLRLIRAAPESKITDWDFKPKDRINLRLLESNGFVRVLSYGTKIYWTITPKGLESINVE